jgi:DNA-binding transcriptional ArsR family regulator
MKADPFHDVLAASGALADAGRMRVLAALATGELCVCQILELLELAPSTVSRHIAILKSAGLVQTRKQGRWIYCSLNERASPVQAQATRWALTAFADSPQGRRDRRTLQKILEISPQELCRKQACRVACCSPTPSPGDIQLTEVQ